MSCLYGCHVCFDTCFWILFERSHILRISRCGPLSDFVCDDVLVFLLFQKTRFDIFKFERSSLRESSKKTTHRRQSSGNNKHYYHLRWKKSRSCGWRAKGVRKIIRTDYIERERLTNESGYQPQVHMPSMPHYWAVHLLQKPKQVLGAMSRTVQPCVR